MPRASELVAKMGARLIGKYVDTPPMGGYPGGRVLVTEVNPDPENGIVLTVKHPTWKTPEHPEGEIGIFDFEIIER